MGNAVAKSHGVVTGGLSYTVLMVLAGVLAFFFLRPYFLPASAYFTVPRIDVQNFGQDEDWSTVRVSYPRTVHKTVSGDWTVEMVSVGSGVSVCQGNGSHKYIQKSNVRDNLLNLEWYLGNACEVSPGEYQLFTRWDFHPHRFVTKRVEQTSNIFRVTPQDN